jgi:tetratricopeptide (TPR) repeat protein
MDETVEFLRPVLADQREMKADPTPQAPAYALFVAGRLREAEAVARQTVSGLEPENCGLATSISALKSVNVASTQEHAALDQQNSPTQNNTQFSLLAEALIAQGIALARLKKFEAAQATLERAIEVAEEAGAPDKGGVAALTMIEELEHLPRETLLSLYEQASAGMTKMRNRNLQWRLIHAARKIMTRFWGEMNPDRALDILLAPPSLHDELIRFEDRLIKHVLAQTNGSLSDSASSFPLVQERLKFIIEVRPKPLLKKRTTTRRRSTKG